MLYNTLQKLCRLLVSVCVCGADIDHKTAVIGHNIVLLTSRNLGNRNLYIAQHLADTLKVVVTQKSNILHSLIECIIALVAGCVATLTRRNSIEHNKSTFANCRLHSRRLADNRHIYLYALLSKVGKHCAHTPLTHCLLLGSNCED